MIRFPVFKAFLTNRGGATALLVALALPTLIAAAGFGAEATFWTYRQRLLQQQGDAAAYAGAVELVYGGSTTTMTAAVQESLSTNGFRSDLGSFAATSSPTTGPFAGQEAVEVTLEEHWPRFFTSLFFNTSVKLAATSTAKAEDLGEACILALHPTASAAVNFTGTSDVDLDGCSVVSNSSASDSISVTGSGKLSTECAGAVGGISTTVSGLTLTGCAKARERIAALADPYKNVPEPTVSGSCTTPNLFDGGPSSTYNITAGRYCGMTVKRTVNLASGMYIIDGADLEISSTAHLSGSGVTFFLTNGARLIVNGTADIDLSAPTSGTYSGLLFFADRWGAPVTHTLSGDASSLFNGAIYTPNDELEVTGTNAAAAGCTQFIARTLDFSGTSGAGISCAGVGTKPLTFIGRVRLVG